MVGSVLKAFGIVVLVFGCLGVVVGGGIVLMGQNEINDSNDQLLGLGSDPERQQSGEEAVEAGMSVAGTSLVLVGIGLILLVAGITIAGRERTGQQQQQQVVVVTGDKAPIIQTRNGPG